MLIDLSVDNLVFGKDQYYYHKNFVFYCSDIPTTG